MEMALSGKGSFEMLGTSLDGLKEKNGELVNANGDVVSSLSDIRKSADGTREGIAILNGTPCEVKVNKDGTIADLRAIDEEAVSYTHLDDVVYRIIDCNPQGRMTNLLLKVVE